MVISNGARAAMAAKAQFSSASLFSGNSPINFVVICKFSGGLQFNFAVGRKVARRLVICSRVSTERSIEVNKRIRRKNQCSLNEVTILGRAFYERDTVTVARALLGKVIVHRGMTGRIMEVEAYLGDGDEAAHSARGRTPRTEVIFGPAGHAYVYLIYGIYLCLNFVVEAEGKAGCVLIRALQPLAGIEQMQRNRGVRAKRKDLARGPGRLTQAMGITPGDNGRDLTAGELTVCDDGTAVAARISKRIGITKSANLPLRFSVRGSEWVSGKI